MGILDSFRLDGKTAWVTGASYGLGAAYAKAFAEACFLSTVIPLKPHDNSLKSSWDIPPNSRTLL